MLKTMWKTEYKSHIIELENRRNLERLIIDGKEIARAPGATWEPRSFQATIPDGTRSMKVDANTRFSKSPWGLRFTVSVDGKEIYSEVKWPPRWYLPFAAVVLGVGLILVSVGLRLFGWYVNESIPLDIIQWVGGTIGVLRGRKCSAESGCP